MTHILSILKIKHLCLCASLILCSFQMYAQLGVKVGLNIANMDIKFNDNALDTKSNEGFYGGLTYDFGKYLILQPGIYFSQKGHREKDIMIFDAQNLPLGMGDTKFTVNYLDMPLNLFIKPKIGFLGIYAGAGLVFSYGFGGTYKVDVGGKSQSYDINFGDSKTEVTFLNSVDNAFDISWQIVAGVEIGKLSLNFNYSMGLLNMTRNQDSEEYNRVVGLTLGYKFWKN